MTSIQGITQKSNAPDRLEARVRLVKWLVNNGLHVLSLRPATGAPNPKKGLPANKGWEKNPLKLEDVEREVKAGRGFGIMPTGSWCYVDLDSDSEHASKADGVGNYKALFKQAGKQLPATLTAKNESNGNLHLFFNMGAISAGVNATGNKPLAPGLELSNVNHYVRVLDPEYNGDTTDAYTFNDSLDLNKSFSELLAPLPAELEPLIATWLKATKPATTAQGKELTDEQYKAHGLNYDSDSLGPVQLFNRWAEKTDLEHGETWLSARLQIATAERLELIEPGEAETMLERLSMDNSKWLEDNEKGLKSDQRKHPKVTFGEFFRRGLLKGMQPLQETGKAQLPANGSETAPDSSVTTPATGETSANPYAKYASGNNRNQYAQNNRLIGYQALEELVNRNELGVDLYGEAISGEPLIMGNDNKPRIMGTGEFLEKYGRTIALELIKYGIVLNTDGLTGGLIDYVHDHQRNLYMEYVDAVAKKYGVHYDTGTGHPVTSNGKPLEYDRYFIDWGAQDTELTRTMTGKTLRAIITQATGVNEQGRAVRNQGLEAIITLNGEGNGGKTTAIQTLALGLDWLYQTPKSFDTQGDFTSAQCYQYGLIISFDDNENVLKKYNEQELKNGVAPKPKMINRKYRPAVTVDPHWVTFDTTNSDNPLQDVTSPRKYYVMTLENGISGLLWNFMTHGRLGEPHGLDMGTTAHELAKNGGTGTLTRDMIEYAALMLAAAKADIIAHDWEADTGTDMELDEQLATAAADFSQDNIMKDRIQDYLDGLAKHGINYVTPKDLKKHLDEQVSTEKDKANNHKYWAEQLRGTGWKQARPHDPNDNTKMLPRGIYRLDETGQPITTPNNSPFGG